ncbi:MAG: glycosyltransferase family 4 protein [Actinomycetota bacterium]|nr:glycosyltransferase family 4 protein [Actinomycetota bacterium]
MSRRIAYVISTTTGGGGAERLLVRLVEEGDARGWDQLILNPFARELPATFADLATSPRYRRRSCDRLAQLPGVRRWVGDELRAFTPDIVHVMLFHALVTVATLPRGDTGKRLLTHVYGEGLRAEGLAGIKGQLDRWAVKRCDGVVAISEAVRRFLVTQYGYPAGSVTCIPPGWEGDPLPTKAADRAPTVVCVAKLRPEKGHDVLLAAFPLVRRQVPDARLVLVGDGDIRPELEAQVEGRGLNGAVEFTGAVPDIWPYLADADVFALASVTEAFGMAIVEAMAAGLPVVAPALGGIPELVTPGVSGELFPPGDHEALARHVVELLTSPRTRSRMGAEARKVAEPLRMTHTIPRYFDLYDAMLSPGRERRTGS